MNNVYIIPAGVIGMQATSSTWARLDREDEPPSATRTLVSGDMEIRLYLYAHADLDDLDDCIARSRAPATRRECARRWRLCSSGRAHSPD